MCQTVWKERWAIGTPAICRGLSAAPPDGHSLPSSLLPPQVLALLQPRGILLLAQTPRAMLSWQLKDSSPLSGGLLHSPLLSYRHHHSLLPLEQALESTSVPALPVRMPEGSNCSRKAQWTYKQDQEALKSFIFLWKSGSVTALVTQHQALAPGK